MRREPAPPIARARAAAAEAGGARRARSRRRRPPVAGAAAPPPEPPLPAAPSRAAGRAAALPPAAGAGRAERPRRSPPAPAASPSRGGAAARDRRPLPARVAAAAAEPPRRRPPRPARRRRPRASAPGRGRRPSIAPADRRLPGAARRYPATARRLGHRGHVRCSACTSPPTAGSTDVQVDQLRRPSRSRPCRRRTPCAAGDFEPGRRGSRARRHVGAPARSIRSQVEESRRDRDSSLCWLSRSWRCRAVGVGRSRHAPSTPPTMPARAPSRAERVPDEPHRGARAERSAGARRASSAHPAVSRFVGEECDRSQSRAASFEDVLESVPGVYVRARGTGEERRSRSAARACATTSTRAA